MRLRAPGPDAPPLALDLTRLMAGVLRAAPRGIDRVEMLYARHFLWSWPGECFSVLTTPAGPRAFTRAQAQRGVRAVAAFWEGDAERPSRPRWVAGARELLCMPPGLGRPAGRLPAGAIYLNVGHLSLAQPGALAWLQARSDVRRVFMLHDVIPLEHPDLVAAREARYFTRLVKAFAVADGAIFNSEAAASAFSTAVGVRPPAVLVQGLPVEPAFLQPPPRAAPRGAPYCLVCGQLEPRKNIPLLLQAWRQLTADARGPFKLIVVGSPGDRGDKLLTQGDGGPLSGDCGVEVRSGLTTEALRALVQGAAALLAPSRAEGFDLPVAEALTLGVPVLASDIPAHREVAGDHAAYLPPDDVEAWAQALRRLRDQPAERARLRAMAAGFEPLAPNHYFPRVEAFLRRIASASVGAPAGRRGGSSAANSRA